MKEIVLFAMCFLLINCKKEIKEDPSNPIVIDSDKFSYVLYDGLTQAIIDPIQNKLDENFSRVLNDLEVGEMSKIRVSIFGSQTSFYNDMQAKAGTIFYGATGWIPNKQDIRVLYVGNNTAQAVLHEFCHAVSLELNGTIGNNPRWLWEAVAVYEADEFVDPKTISYLVNRNFPTIAELSASYNSGGTKIYAVGYILSEYIISQWGSGKYVELIKSNGNIQQVLNLTIQEFESGWREFVDNKYLNK